MNKPALYIIAHNRLDSLEVMLDSLLCSNLTGVRIKIFIDHSEVQNDVVLLVNEKLSSYTIEIDKQERNLGLEEHYWYVFRQVTLESNGAIILEDDLFVVPNFWELANERVKKFAEKFEFISFYHQHFYHQNYFPFKPLGSSYALELPCSWGFYISKPAASRFLSFLENDIHEFNWEFVPKNITAWGSSWKKYYTAYLVHYQEYVIYNTQAICTIQGNSGEHKMSSFYSCELTLNPVYKSDDVFHYDVFMELNNKFFNDLNTWDVTIDLWGSKPLETIRTDYLISAKKCARPIMQFASTLKPLELNVILKQIGEDISFGKTTDFEDSKSSFSNFEDRFANYLLEGNRKNIFKKLLKGK